MNTSTLFSLTRGLLPFLSDLFDPKRGAATLCVGTALITLSLAAPRPQPGTLDASFLADPGTESAITVLAVQPDGRILAGGAFTQFATRSAYGLVRLLPNGSLDPTFNADLREGTLRAIAVQADGKILVSAAFLPPGHSALKRLLPDGSLDTSFHPGPGPSDAPTDIAIDAEGNIFICGPFNQVDSADRRYLARLLPNGQVDETFIPATRRHMAIEHGDTRIALNSRGELVMAGLFAAEGDLDHLVRFDPSGTADPSFAAPLDAVFSYCHSLDILGGGSTLLAGSAGGGTRAFLKKFNADRSADLSFVAPDLSGPIYATALDRSGTIVVGGAFESATTPVRANLARLLADGALDPTFELSEPINGTIHALVFQSGQIIAGGRFTTPSGRANLVRIHARPAAGIDSIRLSGANVELQISGMPGMNYWLECSSDLSSWHAVRDVAFDDSGSMILSAPPSESRCFFRLTPQAE